MFIRNTMIVGAMVFATVAYSQDKTHMRPYIATRLAQAIMQSDQTLPDDDVKEICDGSGWITHGDGHRTPCPGCKACKPDGDIGKTPTSVLETGCTCGCGKDECQCKDGSCQKTEEPKQEVSNILVYHFGAEWCTPCQRMKRDTWGNPSLKKFMADNGIQIHYKDFDTAKDKEYFTYYRVTTFPTVIIIRRDGDRNPERTLVGVFSANTVLPILKAELDDEQ
jgi:thiol-disulfide isomerase/thioredoxin